MAEPHVQIVVDDKPIPPPLQTALRRLGVRVSVRSLGKAADDGVSPTADVCVIVVGQDERANLLEQVMSHASDRSCATMLLPTAASVRVPVAASTPAADRVTRRLHDSAADAADQLSADEITGRIKAMFELRRRLVEMRSQVDRLRQDQHASSKYDQYNVQEQLRLAGQVQADLLPPPLTDTGPLSISTLYLPADVLSGDLYEIARLDEEHIGLSLADATGHGLPAALLTFLIKRSLRGKEIVGGHYRILDPDELLIRLNDELLNTPLSHCHFVTALHAVYDRPTSRVRWARGGSPYPILIRHGQPARLVTSEGGLIGAFPQTFETVNCALEPGDTLVFHTDGVDALILERRGDQRTSILDTHWVRLLENEGPAAALQHIRDMLSRSNYTDWPVDDITAIALHMN